MALGGLAASSACGSAPTTAPRPARVQIDAPTRGPAIDSVPAPRDDGRLPSTATPIHYALDLRIDPSVERFSGVVTIAVEIAQTTSYIVLHAAGERVARIVAHAGGATLLGRVEPRRSHRASNLDEIVVTFDSPLAVGRADVEIAYDAAFSPDLLGLYRVKEADRWYAFSQFEPTHARRAFPCFDEPAFKTPYDVRIVAPRGMAAFSNTPLSSEEPGAGGMVVHTFATSPPMPSYLVAFAVGDFDVREGPRAPLPIRLIATRGKIGSSGAANLALEDASALIAKLADYFDLPYPYAKLDLVAVPDFAAGAMENPGLVTFRDVLLLVDPVTSTTSIRRSQAEVIAHELAHQWFGDLVTMQWWDDVWLNEGFATWAEAKVVDDWRPRFGAGLAQSAAVQGVMDTDALQSARAVREPVRSAGEAEEAFDGLTYEKGAAILRMLEAWLGADTFRRGIQRYLRANASKSARADDLFRALEYVSTQPVGALAKAFLDQSGVPELTWRCDAAAGGRLELRQSEWRPLGEPSRPQRLWTLPACIVTASSKTPSCFTVGPEPMARSLGGQCPRWVYPNAALAGYYRFALDRQQFASLVAAQRSLGIEERVGLVSNAWAAVRQGALGPTALLDALVAFDADPSRLVLDQVVGVLSGVEQALVDNDDWPSFRSYVRARLAVRKSALGWGGLDGHPEGDEERALARRSVLWALGVLATDAPTLLEAERYARAWLKDPANVSSDVAAVAVPLASMRAGESRLNELRATIKAARTPQDRVIALTAMGMFDDPTVLRHALDLTLTEEFRLSELRYVFGEAQNRRGSRGVTYAWTKANWDRLKARLPETALRGFGGLAGTVCTPAQRDDARAFFGAALAGIEGAKRGLDEALERADLCIALHQYGAVEMRRYLTRP